MQVTMFKYLPFGAGKTAHLDRLCLENSRRENRAKFGWLFVCLLLKKCITIKSTQMFGYFCYK